MFVYKLSGCGLKSRCCYWNFRYCACFEQGLPWHSGHYKMQIHSDMRTWHDNNIQSKTIPNKSYTYGWLIQGYSYPMPGLSTPLFTKQKSKGSCRFRYSDRASGKNFHIHIHKVFQTCLNVLECLELISSSLKRFRKHQNQ